MATKKARNKPLVDRMCENDLVFGVELRRHKESKCGLYRNVKDMSTAIQYMKDLKELYPDMEEEIWSVPPSAWIMVYKASMWPWLFSHGKSRQFAAPIDIEKTAIFERVIN